jgi:hypothetical protein
MEKKSFLFYLNWEQQIDLMNDVELRNFIKNLCRFTNGEEVELKTREEKLCWLGILPALENNKVKYEKKVESNRENGKLGGAPKGNQNARKEETTQNNPNNLIRDNSKEINDNSKERIEKRLEKNEKRKLENENWEELNDNCKNEKEITGTNNTGPNELTIEELQNENLRISTDFYKIRKELSKAGMIGDQLLKLVDDKDFSTIETKIGKEKLEQISPLIEEYYEKELRAVEAYQNLNVASQKMSI